MISEGLFDFLHDGVGVGVLRLLAEVDYDAAEAVFDDKFIFWGTILQVFKDFQRRNNLGFVCYDILAGCQNEVEGLADVDIDCEVGESYEIVDVDYPPEDVFVCVEEGLIGFCFGLVFKILLSNVVVKTHLARGLEKSESHLTLKEEFCQFGGEESVKLILCIGVVKGKRFCECLIWGETEGIFLVIGEYLQEELLVA
jgi:hypothetical protein